MMDTETQKDCCCARLGGCTKRKEAEAENTSLRERIAALEEDLRRIQSGLRAYPASHYPTDKLQVTLGIIDAALREGK